MSKNFDNLRLIVSAELENQKNRMTARNATDVARRFGAFVAACLARSGISTIEFARRLDIELELATGILKGVLPVSEIADGLIIEIAEVLGHQPNTLRIILGRTVTPTVDKASADSPETK